MYTLVFINIKLSRLVNFKIDFEGYLKLFRWVDQCDGSHDDNRNFGRDSYPSSKGSVGQNWARNLANWRMASIGESADKMIQMWYDEVSKV